MSLPQIQTPEYKLKIPSTGEEISYRPFVVKEEKLLLMALESQDEQQMIDALRQIIKQCTHDKIDVYSLASFDLEYIFMKLRSKSVGEVVPLKLKSEDGEHTIDVELNLNDVDVTQHPDHDKVIQLTDDIGLVMRYPRFEDILRYQQITNQIDLGLAIIRDCIEQIYEGENVHLMKDQPKEEVEKFIDSLNKEHFDKIIHFFETMPKLSHTIEYEDPYADPPGPRKFIVEGFANFFI